MRATPRRTQAARREEAEAKLLDAALRIVGQRGTTGMTLAQVGEAAGFSRSLPAHYFGSKAGMVQRLLAHIHRRFAAERAAAPPRREGLDAINGMIGVYFIRRDASWTNTRALFVLMAEALNPDSELHDDVATYVREAKTFLINQISLGITQQEIRADVHPALAAELILGGLRGTLIQWLISPTLIELTVARDSMLAIVDRALASGQSFESPWHEGESHHV